MIVWKFNKKVLLRERKRYTARCVASTRYAVPVGGYPPPPSWDLTWMGLPPSQVWMGGYPSPPPADVNRLKILPSLILWMRAVIISVIESFTRWLVGEARKMWRVKWHLALPIDSFKLPFSPLAPSTPAFARAFSSFARAFSSFPPSHPWEGSLS